MCPPSSIYRQNQHYVYYYSNINQYCLLYTICMAVYVYWIHFNSKQFRQG